MLCAGNDNKCDGCPLETDGCKKLWSGRHNMHYCVEGWTDRMSEADCLDGIIDRLQERLEWLELRARTDGAVITRLGEACEACVSKKAGRLQLLLKVAAVALGLSWVAIVVLLLV